MLSTTVFYIGLTATILAAMAFYWHTAALMRRPYAVTRTYRDEIARQTSIILVLSAGLMTMASAWGIASFVALLDLFEIVVTGFVFSFFVFALTSFLFIRETVHYRAALDPYFNWGIALTAIGSILFGLHFIDAIYPLLTFPLPKGIPFDQPLVTFYAMFILFGALIAYQLNVRAFVKKGFKRDYLEDVFLIAFPAGVIGARVWYVWGQWETEFAPYDFFKVFRIWEGGLAIMGGALFGAAAGILYVLWKKRDIPLLDGIDHALPTILVAQAIGRWGNFFNQEVYGAVADVSDWSWLPRFIQTQMTIDGEFRIPLFLIESFVNLLGYVMLAIILRKAFRKVLYPGDIGLLYPVWYGITRIVMEPLRDAQFIMNNWWSYLWGFAFAALGLIGIAVNHLIQNQWKKRKVKRV